MEENSQAVAFTTLLREKLQEKHAVLDFYSDFTKFWISDGHWPPLAVQQALKSEQKNLVIVWQSLSLDKGPARLSPHLTPLDWALAFSSKVIGEEAGFIEPFSIDIVDLSSNSYESSFALQMAASFAEAMPWVRLFAPDPRGRLGYSVFPIDAIQKDRWPDEITKLCKSTHGNILTINRLTLLNKAWQSWVSQGSDHHDLNNYLGAQLMASMIGLPVIIQDDLLISAMFTRLKWCGLLEDGRFNLATTFTWPKGTEILVVDDQLGNGWDRILCALLGVEYAPEAEGNLISCEENDATVRGLTSPELLGQVQHLGLKCEMSEFLSLYQYRGVTDTDPSFLILDLYLFSGKNKEIQEKWYKELASAALKLISSEERLAWPSFSEKDQLEKLAQNGLDGETNIDLALSLLPRLCALRWPMVPILIFSSTQRRGLTTKLADYGNIILSSPKPNVIKGNASEQVGSFIHHWQRDLMAARSLLVVQQSVRMLFAEQSLLVECSALENSSKHIHVTIAFDESGDFQNDSKSAVGGVLLFAQAEDEIAAIKKSFSAQESLRAKGINFFRDPPYYTDANRAGARFYTIKSKKDSIVQELDLAMSASSQDKDVWLAAFCLWVNSESYTFEQIQYKDAAYLDGVASCIELICCELLPQLGDNVTLSWWFPTKQAVYTSSTEAAMVARRLDLWQIPLGGGHPSEMVQSLGGDGNAYSLLTHSLARRKAFASILTGTKSLKVRKIPYPSNGNNHWICHKCLKAQILFSEVCPACHAEVFADYSVLAHLADAVLSPEYFPNTNVGMRNLAPQWSFEVENGEMLCDFNLVSRLFDEGRDDDAFKLAYQYHFFKDGLMKQGSFAQAPIHWRLRAQLREHARNLTGRGIVELSRLSLRNRFSEPPVAMTMIPTNEKQKTVFETAQSYEMQMDTNDIEEQSPGIAGGEKNIGDSQLDHDCYKVIISNFNNAEACKKRVKDSLKKSLGLSITVTKEISEENQPILWFTVKNGRKNLEEMLNILQETYHYKSEWQILGDDDAALNH